MAKKSGFGLPSIFDLGHDQQERVELPPPPKGYRYVPLNPAARRAHPELVLPEDSYAVTPQGTVQGTVPKGALPIPGAVGGGRFKYKNPLHNPDGSINPEGVKERALDRDRLLQQQRELRGLGVKEGGSRATKGGYTGTPLPPLPGQPGQPLAPPTLSYQLPIVKGLYAANDPAGGLYADALISHMMKQGYDLSKTIGMDQPFMKTKAGIAYQTKHGYPAYEGTPIDQTEAERRAAGNRLYKDFKTDWEATNPTLTTVGEEKNIAGILAKDAERMRAAPEISGKDMYRAGTEVPVASYPYPPWATPEMRTGIADIVRMKIPEKGYARPDVPVPREETPWYMSEALRDWLEGPKPQPPSTRMMERPQAVESMSPAVLRDLLTRLDPVAGRLPSSTRQTSAAAINADLARSGNVPSVSQTPAAPSAPAPAPGGGMAEALQNFWKSFTTPPNPDNYAPTGGVPQKYDPVPEADFEEVPQNTTEDTHNQLKNNEEE